MADAALLDTVRVLIADPIPWPRGDPLLSDDALAALLTLNGDDARLAAADALETIAVSEVLVSKKIRTQDLTTDGPAVSAELRALAKRLRDAAQAAAGLADAFDGFDLVDTVPSGCGPLDPELVPRYVTGM